MNRRLTAIWLVTVLVAFVLGLLIGPVVFNRAEIKGKYGLTVPSEIEELLTGRFKFINEATGDVLREYKLIGGVIGSYVEGGEIYETYVFGFEDRPRGAKADRDYLDLMVEVKRVRGNDLVVVRIAQLGLDEIEIYLDNELIGIARSSIEMQVKL